MKPAKADFPTSSDPAHGLVDRLRFWDAAAHPSSLTVVLIGALIVLPFIIAYTAFSYYVFRGKARPGLYD